MSVEVISWKFARERKPAFAKGKEAIRNALGRIVKVLSASRLEVRVCGIF